MEIDVGEESKVRLKVPDGSLPCLYDCKVIPLYPIRKYDFFSLHADSLNVPVVGKEELNRPNRSDIRMNGGPMSAL